MGVVERRARVGPYNPLFGEEDRTLPPILPAK